MTEEEATQEEVAEEVAGAATPRPQEGHPQGTPEGEITDSSDNLRTYSPETAQRRRSSSRSGNFTTT